jgi:F-type H+-transporting ATPase subunit delta
MIQNTAAKRYAEAAYLIAREDGTEAQWLQGLTALAALAASEEAQAVLENARIPPSRKWQLVERVLGDADPLVKNLARLLLRRNKLRLAPEIKEAFQQLVDEARGVHHARVTTAVPLDPDDLRAVRQRLAEITGGEVVVETEVDESILGGLIVRIGDRLIDGSARTRLQALKRRLQGTAP